VKCPKCRAESHVLRTDALAEGKRRQRQCLNPGCRLRFTTTETQTIATSVQMAIDSHTHDAMVASLKDGRGYDREALTAALNTDRRRAEIARAQRAAKSDDDYDSDLTPSRLTWPELRGWLGR
jgi:transcriptional regulator NrdR family protein